MIATLHTPSMKFPPSIFHWAQDAPTRYKYRNHWDLGSKEVKGPVARKQRELQGRRTIKHEWFKLHNTSYECNGVVIAIMHIVHINRKMTSLSSSASKRLYIKIVHSRTHKKHLNAHDHSHCCMPNHNANISVPLNEKTW